MPPKGGIPRDTHTHQVTITDKTPNHTKTHTHAIHTQNTLQAKSKDKVKHTRRKRTIHSHTTTNLCSTESHTKIRSRRTMAREMTRGRSASPAAAPLASWPSGRLVFLTGALLLPPRVLLPPLVLLPALPSTDLCRNRTTHAKRANEGSDEERKRESKVESKKGGKERRKEGAKEGKKEGRKDKRK